VTNIQIWEKMTKQRKSYIRDVTFYQMSYGK